MDEKKIDHGLLLGVVVWITICVVILAAIPVFQLWLIKHWVGLEGFKEYLKSINPAFYQFVITVVGVLAAVAGYLTYKSRQEAKQEVEEIRDELREKAEELRKEKEEVDRFCDDTKKTLQDTIDSITQQANYEMNRFNAACEVLLSKAADEVKKKSEQTTDGFKRIEEDIKKIAEEKMAKIAAIQLPSKGETDKEREVIGTFNKASNALRSHNYEDAANLLSEVIKIRPDWLIAYLARGIALIKLGKYTLAIADFNKAIEISPNSSDAYGARGVARLRLGDFQNAIMDFDKTIEIDAKDKEAYYNRACARAKLKNVDLSASDLKHAIELDGKYLQMARKDKDFDGVREEAAIVEILGKPPYKE